ncbi:MAG: nucleotide pyrophosphohydrolase [Gammaproteobacteria bacterium]|nr:nucleotide pyrophosphohydrolase [Gammaproteobacteria bacterium]
MKDLEEVRAKVAEFASERDWDKFHSPKNLAMALSVEVAELVETFQWLTEAESSSLSIEQLAAVGHEIADVQVYLVRLADKLGVDILHLVEEKMRLNAHKYPVLKVRGSAKKYTEY